MKALSLLAIAGLTMAASLAGAGAAAADPTKAQTLTLACDNGSTYTVVVNSSGAWSPAHDVNSTATLIPVSFGEVHGTVTDANGSVVDEFTDPAMVKGRSGSQHRATSVLHLHERRHVRRPGPRPAPCPCGGFSSRVRDPARLKSASAVPRTVVPGDHRAGSRQR